MLSLQMITKRVSLLKKKKVGLKIEAYFNSGILAVNLQTVILALYGRKGTTGFSLIALWDLFHKFSCAFNSEITDLDLITEREKKNYPMKQKQTEKLPTFPHFYIFWWTVHCCVVHHIMHHWTGFNWEQDEHSLMIDMEQFWVGRFETLPSRDWFSCTPLNHTKFPSLTMIMNCKD